MVLVGHATAQDAQATERPFVDDGNFCAEFLCRACRGVSSTPAAYDDDVVIHGDFPRDKLATDNWWTGLKPVPTDNLKCLFNLSKEFGGFYA